MGLIIDEIETKIDGMLEDYQKYCETHDDSGDNYGHMPRESYSSTETNNLKDLLSRHEIEVNDIEALEYKILDNFNMVSKHQFSTFDHENVFYLGSYAIQEIEHEIELNKIHPNLTPARAKIIFNSLGYCFSMNSNSALFYTTTDVIWSAEISIDEIKQIIEDNEF